MKARLRLDVWRAGVAVAALLLPGLALASIGKITVLEGTARRTDASGQEHALQIGSEIEVKDTLHVGAASNLKLTLNDESVLMLGENSRLHIDEATFEGQERRSFSAKLGVGKLWTRVKKALGGSEAKFEVTTERAVAGVRGTVFRVDYGGTAKAALPSQGPRMVVRVVEGRVVVEAMVRKAVKNAAPVPGSQKGERKQIAGPQEISLEEWERKFVELQARQQVEVGSELGVARPLDLRAMKDTFGRFVDRHQ